MDWSKRLITTQKNYRYCKKIPSENKTPDTTGLLLLTKINFDRRMNEATEYLASKSQVNPALDVADKNREQMACILIQSKGLWYKTISSVFGKYFKRLYSQLIVMKKNQKTTATKKLSLWDTSTIFLFLIRLLISVISWIFTYIWSKTRYCINGLIH